MKYIKETIIEETPIMVEISGGISIELSDTQLRSLGYKPLDEVIIEQGDELMVIDPDVEKIKEELVNSIDVVIPESGFPFKLGYKWVPRIVEGNRVIFESIRSEDSLGTRDNPIIFVDNVILVPNAYYLYEGDLYVYVGLTRDIAKDWDSVSQLMEKFN